TDRHRHPNAHARNRKRPADGCEHGATRVRLERSEDAYEGDNREEHDAGDRGSVLHCTLARAWGVPFLRLSVDPTFCEWRTFAPVNIGEHFSTFARTNDYVRSPLRVGCDTLVASFCNLDSVSSWSSSLEVRSDAR